MAKIVQETRYELADGELLALRGAGGMALDCRVGELWITVDGLGEDIILGPGRRWLAPSDAPVVVSALKDSLLVASRSCDRPAHCPPRGRAEWLLDRLLRWRHAPLAAMPAGLLR